MATILTGTNVEVTITVDGDDVSFRYRMFGGSSPTASPEVWPEKPPPNYGPPKRERKNKNYRRSK